MVTDERCLPLICEASCREILGRTPTYGTSAEVMCLAAEVIRLRAEKAEAVKIGRTLLHYVTDDFQVQSWEKVRARLAALQEDV